MNLKRSLGFKGEGVKGSPVVIDDLGNTCVELTIKTKDVHLVLRNLTISKVRILNSQNVAIENCFVGKLKTVRCRNLAFRNNTIVNARQIFSKSCFFANNSVNGSRKKWSGKEQLRKDKRFYKKAFKKIAKNWNFDS